MADHAPTGAPGLRSVRAGLGPATVVSPGAGHLALQTPSRQDFRDGNALHVGELVEASSLQRWLWTFEQRLRHLSQLRHVRLDWESDATLPEPAAYATRMRRAVAEHGLELTRCTVMEAARELRPLVPLTEGVEVVRADRDEHWYGVRALNVSNAPAEPGSFWTWRTEQLRALARAGQGRSWLAYRFGIPVATVSVLAGGEGGLAGVEGVITHPVHRRLGLASHLVAVAATSHRAEHAHDRILLLVEHGSDAERLYGRLGFHPCGTVWSVTGPWPAHGARADRG